MITKEELLHWIHEITYANNGIIAHLNKPGFKKTDGFMHNGEHMSLTYLNEKTTTISQLVESMTHDMIIPRPLALEPNEQLSHYDGIKGDFKKLNKHHQHNILKILNDLVYNENSSNQ